MKTIILTGALALLTLGMADSPPEEAAPIEEAAPLEEATSEDSLPGVWKRISVTIADNEEEMAGTGDAYLMLTETYFSSIDDRGAQWGTYTVEGDQLIRHRLKSTRSRKPAKKTISRTFRLEDDHLILTASHPTAGAIEVKFERVE